MKEFEDRLNSLSPEKRKLLKKIIEKNRLSPEKGPLDSRGHYGKHFPLSFSQQRMWFHSRLDPDHIFYNAAFSIHFLGSFNVQVLEKSVREIYRRHEILRTTFHVRDGQPVQIVSERDSFVLETRDFRSISPEEMKNEVDNFISHEIIRKFDLENGPLMRTILIKQGEEDNLLLFIIHHIVFDGWSTTVFLRELSLLYEAYLLHQKSPLENLTVQYVDYSKWDQEKVKSERYLNDLAFWKKHLRGAPSEITLPKDHKPQQDRSNDGTHYKIEMGRELADQLDQYCRDHGFTLFNVFLASMKIVLCKWARQSDMVIGIVNANRDRVELNNLIGCFIDFLP